MIIINKGADYSATGLGKIAYVSNEVDAMLAVYSEITTLQKQTFQRFIDEIGGLSGSIWPKIHYFFCPFLSASVAEALTDLKGNTTIFPTNTVALTSIYNLVDKGLNQIGLSNINTGYSIGALGSVNVYKISGFAIVGVESALTQMYYTKVGSGNLSRNANLINSFMIQKTDGSNNQVATVIGSSTAANHVYGYSGLSGIDATNQNLLIVDGVEGLQAITPSFNLSFMSNIGSVGVGSSALYPKKMKLMGYCLDLTREETRTINAALIKFIDALV